MRRTTIRRGAAALLVATITTIGIGGAFAARAAAAELPAPAAQEAPAPVMPSCSLHPDRLGDGTATLTNRGAERRFLQVIGEDGSILWNQALDVGESTPPLRLGPAAFIGWGDGYPFSAYELRGWCVETAVTTTTAPPSPLAPPPSTTAAPPTTTVAPPSTTIPAAPPASEPPISCLDDRCETLTTAQTGVEASSATRGPLPTTGGQDGVLTLLGGGLLLLGAGATFTSRSRRLAR